MKLFLDTNVYIIGQQIPGSPEDKILNGSATMTVNTMLKRLSLKN